MLQISKIHDNVAKAAEHCIKAINELSKAEKVELLVVLSNEVERAFMFDIDKAQQESESARNHMSELQAMQQAIVKAHI